MPIYEYICHACEHRFEELVQSASGPHPKACPACSATQVGRAISVFAAHQGAPQSSGSGPGGCGRCGDPAGPCQL